MSELTVFKIEELSSIKNELHSMDKKIELLTVRFDEYLKNKCTDHNKRIEILEKQNMKLSWKIAQITAISGIVGGVITTIITKFLIK